MKETISRRKMLQAMALGAAGAALAACAPGAPIPATLTVSATQPTATTQPGAPTPTEAPPTALPPTEVPPTPLPTNPPPPAFQESPILAELVKAGTLPPVEERLPVEPLVLKPDESTGEYGGTTVTRVNSPGDWGDIWHVTFPHLIWVDQTVTQYIPDLAKDFKFNEDKTVLTIYLRKGLKWSDGTLFTADDLLCWWSDYTMNKAINPDQTPPSQWAPGGKAMDVVKVDDLTVEYHFAVPYPMALNVMTSWQGMQGQLFLPSALVRKYHIDYNPDADADAKAFGYNTWQEAVSGIANLMWPGADVNNILPTLGMWRMSSINSTMVTFERNPYYWAVDTAGNQLPYIDAAQAEIVPDNEAYVVNIIQGKYTYGKVPADKIELIKANEVQGNYKVMLYSSDVASSPVFAFNVNHKDSVLAEVFQDVRFRRAMSLAINREDINNLVFNGYGTPTQATVNKTASFFDSKWAAAYANYDVDTANQLLDEMGLDKKGADGVRLRPDGKPLSFVINANDNASQLVAKYWAAVGVKADLNAIDANLYWTRAAAGDLDLGTWGLDNTVEIKVFTNVSKFSMRSGDLGFAVDWALWQDTNGEQGAEPPEDVKEFFKNWNAIQSASGDDYQQLAKKIFDFYADQVYLIGTVGYGLNAVYMSNLMHNVPEDILFMDPTNWWLLARPDSWYFGNPV